MLTQHLCGHSVTCGPRVELPETRACMACVGHCALNDFERWQRRLRRISSEDRVYDANNRVLSLDHPVCLEVLAREFSLLAFTCYHSRWQSKHVPAKQFLRHPREIPRSSNSVFGLYADHIFVWLAFLVLAHSPGTVPSRFYKSPGRAGFSKRQLFIVDLSTALSISRMSSIVNLKLSRARIRLTTPSHIDRMPHSGTSTGERCCRCRRCTDSSPRFRLTW
jgi:hypothetical protein